MPITCRRTVIHADIVDLFMQACGRVRVRVRTHTHTNSNTCTCAFRTHWLTATAGVLLLKRKGHLWSICVIIAVDQQKYWYNHIHSPRGKGQGHNTGPALKQSRETTIHSVEIIVIVQNYFVENRPVHIRPYFYVGHSVAANTPSVFLLEFQVVVCVLFVFCFSPFSFPSSWAVFIWYVQYHPAGHWWISNLLSH